MEGDTGTEGAPPAFDAASASKRLSNFLSFMVLRGVDW
jgi:hypothetical protein